MVCWVSLSLSGILGMESPRAVTLEIVLSPPGLAAHPFLVPPHPQGLCALFLFNTFMTKKKKFFFFTFSVFFFFLK